MGIRRGVPLAIASTLLLVFPVLLAAQTTACHPGVPEVEQVSFSGNAAVPDRMLASVIETRESSGTRRLLRFFGERNCLAPGALVRDVARLMLYYRRVGYPRVAVDTAVVRPNAGTV